MFFMCCRTKTNGKCLSRFLEVSWDSAFSTAGYPTPDRIVSLSLFTWGTSAAHRSYSLKPSYENEGRNFECASVFFSLNYGFKVSRCSVLLRCSGGNGMHEERQAFLKILSHRRGRTWCVYYYCPAFCNTCDAS